MDLSLWIIISLVTNLSGDFSKDFTLIVEREAKEVKIEVYHMFKHTWTAEIHVPDENSRNMAVNYSINDGTVFNFFILEQKIDLNKFTDTKKIDWKKINESKLLKELTDNGEETIKIKRDKNGFSISQKKGFLDDYTKIVVKW